MQDLPAPKLALNGRGGGKPGICQGSCAATPEQVEEFLKKDL